MKLSDTQRIVLSHGAQHPQLLAIAPKHLPVAACRAVVNSLIKSRLLIEVAAPRDQLAMVWRKDADGTPILIQVTDEGLRAIGIDPNEGRVARDPAPQGGEDNAPHADEQPSDEPAQAAPEGRLNYLQKVHGEHDSILNAIRNQDTEAARAAMRTHLSNSRERLRKTQTLEAPLPN